MSGNRNSFCQPNVLGRRSFAASAGTSSSAGADDGEASSSKCKKGETDSCCKSEEGKKNGVDIDGREGLKIESSETNSVHHEPNMVLLLGKGTNDSNNAAVSGRRSNGVHPALDRLLSFVVRQQHPAAPIAVGWVWNESVQPERRRRQQQLRQQPAQNDEGDSATAAAATAAAGTSSGTSGSSWMRRQQRLGGRRKRSYYKRRKRNPGMELMNRNARRGKRANRGKRPCSRSGRRDRRNALGNHRR